MAGHPRFWYVEDRLRQLSARGDPLEKLSATVDFELFRPDLKAAVGPRDLSKGGRPPLEVVVKFRMLVLQALHGLSLDQTEYLGTRPAELDALLPVGTGRRCTGRQDALGFP